MQQNKPIELVIGDADGSGADAQSAVLLVAAVAHQARPM
jgi:hypothetical protein